MRQERARLQQEHQQRQQDSERIKMQQQREMQKHNERDKQIEHKKEENAVAQGEEVKKVEVEDDIRNLWTKDFLRKVTLAIASNPNSLFAKKWLHQIQEKTNIGISSLKMGMAYYSHRYSQDGITSEDDSKHFYYRRAGYIGTLAPGKVLFSLSLPLAHSSTYLLVYLFFSSLF
jgi:hypothetical protein